MPISITQLKLIGAVLFVIAVFFSGVHYANLQHDRDDLQELNQKLKEVAELKAKVNDVESAYLHVASQLGTNNKETIRYVTKVITKEADAKCVIPSGFIRLHDNSVRGLVTSPELTDGNATDVKLSEVGTTVADNYFICNKEIEKLIKLQEVIRAHKEKK
ncbi:MAG TPA: hypothetical protein PK317_00585 [Coprothermobacter proteolyticus]|mgnify:CR=1 FL=1|nr:hypothetical protein [Coprothermobacter proteolyticus]